MRRLLALEGSTFAAFVTANTVVQSVPAIVLQLVLIPALVIAMERAGLSLNETPDGTKRADVHDEGSL